MLRPSIFHDSLFDDFFDFPFYDDKAARKAEKKLYGHHVHDLMKTDIKEKKDGYELIIDLPGFHKDQVSAELTNGYLVISAAKGMDQESSDKASERYLRRERFAGSCQRSYYVGEDISEEDIKPEFKHGVLKLFVPKKEAQPVEDTKKIHFHRGLMLTGPSLPLMIKAGFSEIEYDSYILTYQSGNEGAGTVRYSVCPFPQYRTDTTTQQTAYNR